MTQGALGASSEGNIRSGHRYQPSLTTASAFLTLPGIMADDVVKGENIVENLLNSYRDALRERGIGEAFCAEKSKEFLTARKIVHVKAQGMREAHAKLLPENYKVVLETVLETVIEVSLQDYGVQQRELHAVQHILGFKPAHELNLGTGFDSVMQQIAREVMDEAEGLPPLPSEREDE